MLDKDNRNLIHINGDGPSCLFNLTSLLFTTTYSTFEYFEGHPNIHMRLCFSINCDTKKKHVSIFTHIHGLA